jgi:hypothetical protein
MQRSNPSNDLCGSFPCYVLLCMMSAVAKLLLTAASLVKIGQPVKDNRKVFDDREG